jgi:hypothetical protein
MSLVGTHIVDSCTIYAGVPDQIFEEEGGKIRAKGGA